MVSVWCWLDDVCCLLLITEITQLLVIIGWVWVSLHVNETAVTNKNYVWSKLRFLLIFPLLIFCRLKLHYLTACGLNLKKRDDRYMYIVDLIRMHASDLCKKFNSTVDAEWKYSINWLVNMNNFTNFLSFWSRKLNHGIEFKVVIGTVCSRYTVCSFYRISLDWQQQ